MKKEINNLDKKIIQDALAISKHLKEKCNPYTEIKIDSEGVKVISTESYFPSES